VGAGSWGGWALVGRRSLVGEMAGGLRRAQTKEPGLRADDHLRRERKHAHAELVGGGVCLLGHGFWEQDNPLRVSRVGMPPENAISSVPRPWKGRGTRAGGADVG